jgi:hypothetical protein
VALKATATGIGPLVSLSKAGSVLGSNLVTNILTQDDYLSILDPSKAFIGDTNIDAAQLAEVAYTGEQVAKVYMPISEDGSPDLAEMDNFNKVYKTFNENKDSLTTSEIYKLFKDAGFSGVQIKETKNADGSITKILAENNRVKPFLAMPIITNSASDISNNP